MNEPYLYFEIVTTFKDGEISKEEVRKENVLKYKPHTNSDGWFCYTFLEHVFNGERDNVVMNKNTKLFSALQKGLEAIDKLEKNT